MSVGGHKSWKNYGDGLLSTGLKEKRKEKKGREEKFSAAFRRAYIHDVDWILAGR